jgi:hypothetical protein
MKEDTAAHLSITYMHNTGTYIPTHWTIIICTLGSELIKGKNEEAKNIIECYRFWNLCPLPHKGIVLSE